MPASVSICIPTYNRKDSLCRTLRTVANIVQVPGLAVEVIVVANNCSDGTEDAVENFGCFSFPLRCVTESRPGLNMARNRAITESSGEIIVFFDDDVLVDKAYLEGIRNAYTNQECDIVSGKTALNWSEGQKPDWFPDRLLYLLSRKDFGPEPTELFLRTDAIGANFSFRRKILSVANRFRPGLDRTGDKLLGGGETDFIERALRAGARMFYEPRCFVEHVVASHRTGHEYLGKVAQGTAMSYVFIRERFDPLRVLKGLTVSSAMYVWHRLLGLIYSFSGRKENALWHHVRAMAQKGNLLGILFRLMGRSPLQEGK